MQEYAPSNAPRPVPGAQLLGLDASNKNIAVLLLEGLDPSVVTRLAEHLALPKARVLDLASIPTRRYYDRQRRGTPLSASDSDALYRIAMVVETAEAYFVDGDAAWRWLSRPKWALGGRTPLAFARTGAGAQYIVDLLRRLEHGVIA